ARTFARFICRVPVVLALSLHDALPIFVVEVAVAAVRLALGAGAAGGGDAGRVAEVVVAIVVEGDAVVAGVAHVLHPGQVDRLARRVGMDVLAAHAFRAAAGRALDLAWPVSGHVRVAQVHGEVRMGRGSARTEQEQQAGGKAQVHGRILGGPCEQLHRLRAPAQIRPRWRCWRRAWCWSTACACWPGWRGWRISAWTGCSAMA